jgi:hypothetical protein
MFGAGAGVALEEVPELYIDFILGADTSALTDAISAVGGNPDDMWATSMVPIGDNGTILKRYGYYYMHVTYTYGWTYITLRRILSMPGDQLIARWDWNPAPAPALGIDISQGKNENMPTIMKVWILMYAYEDSWNGGKSATAYIFNTYEAALKQKLEIIDQWKTGDDDDDDAEADHRYHVYISERDLDESSPDGFLLKLPRIGM